MASKFAQRLAQIARTPNTEWTTSSARVDTELAEVREVLDALQSLGQKNCWCRFTGNEEHSITCQRARELYEKLRTDK